MIKFIKQFFEWLLGIHICQEFTQWQIKEADFTRLPDDMNERIVKGDVIEYTKKWQERRCTLCGKIQQRELRY